ncbi:hypothetical protein [Amycolatopsis sp.]|uniref:hypothetical protein n=1 Tax=Amycolatopsis sp. TaxID=37632 RepID=UPI00260751FA|nr:hypothetical protein [Amycolatopsis sp.]
MPAKDAEERAASGFVRVTSPVHCGLACLVGRGRLLLLLLDSHGDCLQGAHGRLDVVDVELVQQPDGRTADVLAQAVIPGFPLGRQVDLPVVADQSLGLEPGQQCARGIGVEVS